MDADAKKTTLRMIPYGLYLLTAESASGDVAGACVNWVTQASFVPPLIAVGVKADSGAHRLIAQTKQFALNVLGKGQHDQAFAFFKPVEKKGMTIGGEVYRRGTTGSPIIESARAYLECSVVEWVERGDHAIVIGEVVEAGVSGEIEGRPDDATLWLKELGDKVFYGG